LIALPYRDTVLRMVRHFLSPVVTKAVAGLVFGCVLSMLPARASAQDPAPAPAPAPASSGALGQGFGEQGQIVISGDASAHFDKANKAGWIFEIRPAADYFIMPSVTLGAVVGFGIDSDENKGVLLGGRAGYSFNVNENLSLWGRAGLSYNRISSPTTPGMSVTNSATALNLSLPIMYHFVPHFFAAISPYYNLNFSGNDSYGFASVVGGWF
jgi:hypothetical protein